jgi:hypothetical protein
MANFDINYPKKAPAALIKKTEKALEKIEAGSAQLRKSNRNGYRTLSMGGAERLVMVGRSIFVFNKHKAYETFIDNPAHC